ASPGGSRSIGGEACAGPRHSPRDGGLLDRSWDGLESGERPQRLWLDAGLPPRRDRPGGLLLRPRSTAHARRLGEGLLGAASGGDPNAGRPLWRGQTRRGADEAIGLLVD